MKKDFQKWSKLKEQLHKTDKRLFFHEREIWFCSLGANVGFEQDGKNEKFERPILILKKFNNHVFLALPLTSQAKAGKFYFRFNFKDQDYSVILSQIRILDIKRLSRKIRTFPLEDFEKIRFLIKEII
jgi:mRNA-degrading endonuclease toxin of MazEF toxin-antitoxin module